MTSHERPSSRILGTLGSADGVGVARIEDRYDTDIDDLWAAITDPDRLARWYGDVKGDLRAGGEFRLFMESNGWDGGGRILECDPPRLLRVVTRESDESYLGGIGTPPFDELIVATLTAVGNKTDLVIELKGMPLDKVQFYGAGWQQHAEALADYLAGREVNSDEARFEELVPAYQEMASRLRS